MTIPTPTTDARLFAIVRTAVVIVAIVAIVLGVIALFLPGITVTTIGVLFGIFLAISGIQRIARSLALRRQLGGWFLVGLVVGILVLVAGILSIAHPVGGVAFIAIMIGVSWVLGGLVDLVSSVRPKVSGLGILGGVLSVLAGLVVLFAPAFAVSAFLVVAAILLIVVGVGILLTFPRTLPGTVATTAGD